MSNSAAPPDIALRPPPRRLPQSTPTWPAIAGAWAAALWAIGFAVVNGWVQAAAALDASHQLNDHLLGLALLNGMAIVLKLVGAAAALLAVSRAMPSRLAGPVLAVLVAAVTTLGAYALLSGTLLAADGALSDRVVLAGGTIALTAWAYPAFFLAGAAAFALPLPHLASRTPQVRRWLAVGALAGPPAVIGAIVITSAVLTATGLLPQ